MSTHHNQPLAKPLRTQLENTVKAAREAAEKGARAALSQLAVGEPKAPDYLTDELKALRRRLRAHGRALGDKKAADDTQGLQHLVWEVAYEHWHRMLFARFLAENGLLLWEPGAAVSLDDCEALVQETDPTMNLGAKTKWELAGKLAARMLPQVFKPQSPVFELAFAPEHQRELERLLAALPTEVFQASDSLGWVYQFWQAKRKDEVNASEVKIGADELPAVTQLFTEPYMVDFLLHNSLGAWWATRHPGKPCPVNSTYLRTLEDGTPAAGKFEGWPDSLAEFKLLDPCCGSGHFLVAAFLMLVPMRMAAEHLSTKEAVNARAGATTSMAWSWTRAAWKSPCSRWRSSVAFSGRIWQPLGRARGHARAQHRLLWAEGCRAAQTGMALVPDEAPNAAYVRQELRLLHDSFSQAPLLGSLLDPARSLKNDLATSSFDTLRDLLERALSTERPATLWGEGNEMQDEAWDHALTARGLLDAARLLDARYHLVVTNVPYLARGKQSDALKAFCESHYPEAKNDLANVFLERCLELSQRGAAGVVQIVMPQNWLFLTSYRKQRESLLKRVQWNLLARLGAGAFDTISGEVVQAVLLTQTHAPADETFALCGVDASRPKGVAEKAALLRDGEVVSVRQKTQLGNPDKRISFEKLADFKRLEEYSTALAGCLFGDGRRFVRKLWEIDSRKSDWEFHQTTIDKTQYFGGMDEVIYWQKEQGEIYRLAHSVRHLNHVAQNWLRGKPNWGRRGVIVSQMGDFDLAHWQQVAAERYPNGLPKPYSDDPTQWMFHGHPQPATDPLQVAIARLLGYRWPAETDADMELSDEARPGLRSPTKLAAHADDDGIVCLPPVRGEKPAARAPARPAHRRLGNRHPWQLESLHPRQAAGRGRLRRQEPGLVAAREVLRAARQALPPPALHLARLGRPQGRLRRAGQLPQARPQEPGAPHPHLPGRLDSHQEARRARWHRRRPDLRLAAAQA
jgi:hypothetical protein